MAYLSCTQGNGYPLFLIFNLFLLNLISILLFLKMLTLPFLSCLYTSKYLCILQAFFNKNSFFCYFYPYIKMLTLLNIVISMP